MFSKRVLLNIEITPSCPARCYMCPRELVHENGFMTLETMQKIVNQVDNDWVWEMDMAGRGEPSIHPLLPELASIMKKPNVVSCIVTTGVSFTERNIEACDQSFDLIRLSVSSIHKATFEQVHIGLNYEKVWRNISALAKVAAHKTIIHLTGGPKIYDHLPETVAHLRTLGFHRLHLLTLWNRGGSFETQLDLAKRKSLMTELAIPPAENEAWYGIGKEKFLANVAYGKQKNQRYCPIGDSSLSISYDGNVLGCFQDFGHTSNVGHIDTMNLRDFINQRTALVGNMRVCQGCDAYKVSYFNGELTH